MSIKLHTNRLAYDPTTNTLSAAPKWSIRWESKYEVITRFNRMNEMGQTDKLVPTITKEANKILAKMDTKATSGSGQKKKLLKTTFKIIGAQISSTKPKEFMPFCTKLIIEFMEKKGQDRDEELSHLERSLPILQNTLVNASYKSYEITSIFSDEHLENYLLDSIYKFKSENVIKDLFKTYMAINELSIMGHLNTNYFE